MKPNALKQRLHRHFIACSAVPGAALVLGGHQTAEAAVTYFVPGSPIPIPNTFEGIYLNLENGIFGSTQAAAPGWDVNPYGTGNLTFYSATATGAGIGFSGTTVASLPAGTDFGAITFDPATFNLAAGAAILAGGTHFIAMQFVNGSAVLHNAWIEISTNPAQGHPAVINRWAYAPPGEPGFVVGTMAGGIPEVSTSALALLAAGAAGMRRRRAA